VAGGEVDGGTIEMSKSEFESWLRQRVASRTPAAVVRFGDGEVRLLEAVADDAESMHEANRQLQWETGRKFSSEAVLEIKAALEHARSAADVLGILVRNPHTETSRAWVNRLAPLSRERRSAGAPAAALAYCHLNHEILAALPALLAGRRVSVISCRDIKPIIEEMWGLDDVAVYQVPSQYRVRNVDGAYEATMYDIPIWPDAHDHVRSELTVRERGEVFLVGAGLFGKDLCIHVREQGGIALDMGSALDHIAGKLTRSAMRQMLELHADGMSVPDIAASLRDHLGVQVDHERIREFTSTVSRYFR
jgi:hypothetical protein